jgi:hypothetical protein
LRRMARVLRALIVVADFFKSKSVYQMITR